jgi:hypothetical protein
LTFKKLHAKLLDLNLGVSQVAKELGICGSTERVLGVQLFLGIYILYKAAF